MRKKDLELLLQNLDVLDNSNNLLEQYRTPVPIAADLLHLAYMHGDIEGKVIADLGCGNGIFAIGAAILGAENVYALDLDPEQIKVARKNAKALDLNLQFKNIDVKDFDIEVHTILENPPFGSQVRNANIPFIEKIKFAKVSYILYHQKSIDFVYNKIKELGHFIDFQKSYRFELPYQFKFHKKTKKYIKVILLRVKGEFI
jgi:putative methylase